MECFFAILHHQQSNKKWISVYDLPLEGLKILQFNAVITLFNNQGKPTKRKPYFYTCDTATGIRTDILDHTPKKVIDCFAFSYFSRHYYLTQKCTILFLFLFYHYYNALQLLRAGRSHSISKAIHSSLPTTLCISYSLRYSTNFFTHRYSILSKSLSTFLLHFPVYWLR